MMKISPQKLSIINLLLQIDNDWKARQFPIQELSIALEIFSQIKKNVDESGNNFIDGEITLTSEQKVFLLKLIDERSWTVVDAEHVFDLKSLLK